MKLVPESTSLVVAGAWNSALLTPNWIARHCLDFAPQQQFNVQVKLALPELAAPRLRFEGLDFSVTPSHLQFVLPHGNDELCDKAVRTAKVILEKLTYTPVTAIGFNFTFECAEAPASLLARFANGNLVALLDGDATVKQQQSSVAIAYAGDVLNVSLQLDAAVSLQVNVHHECSEAAAAAAFLVQDVYQAKFNCARQFAEKICEQELEAA